MMKEISEIKKGDTITILPGDAPVMLWHKTGVVIRNPRTYRGKTRFYVECDGVCFWYSEREVK